MPAWSSYSYLFGPLVAFAAIGGLALVLRWAFGRGGSLVERPVRPGPAADYGMLVAVATPVSPAQGEAIVRGLAAEGVRATLARTQEGLRVMVFAGDESAARSALRRGGPAPG